MFENFAPVTYTQTRGAHTKIDLTRESRNGFLRGAGTVAVDLTGRRFKVSVLNSKPGYCSIHIYANAEYCARTIHVRSDARLVICGTDAKVREWIQNPL